MSGQRPESDAIVIPPSALAPKPWFAESPTDSVKHEILQFIRDRNPIYLCPYHTHSKPPHGARVEYIGEFDVPADLPMAPCPCCCPVRPKFREGGKIAWFPDEHLIRLIGPDCFRTLNPEGHEEALRKLGIATKRARTMNYLLGRAGDVPGALSAINRNLQIAIALDTVHTKVMAALREHRISLWDHIRSGVVSVDQQKVVHEVDRSGKHIERVVHSSRHVGVVAGVNFYNPNYRALAPRLKQADVTLKTVDFRGNFETRVRQASDAERLRWARALGGSVDKASRATEELQEIRRGLSPEAMGTLRSWGRLAETPCKFYIKREAEDLLLGRTDIDYTRIKRALRGVGMSSPTCRISKLSRNRMLSDRHIGALRSHTKSMSACHQGRSGTS